MIFPGQLGVWGPETVHSETAAWHGSPEIGHKPGDRRTEEVEGHRTGAEEADLRQSLPAKLNRGRHLPTLPQSNRNYLGFSTTLGLLEAAHYQNVLVTNNSEGRFCVHGQFCVHWPKGTHFLIWGITVFMYICINETQISLMFD